MDFTQADHTFIALRHFENATDLFFAGTADDVQTYLRGFVYILHSPLEDGVANDPGVTYEIQVSHHDSSEQTWVPIVTLTASTAASTGDALDDTAAEGQTVVPVVATTDFTIGSHIYIKDDHDALSAAATGSQFAQVASISAGVSITVVNNLEYAFVSGDDVFVGGVQQWVVPVDLDGVARLRVVVYNADATGCDWASVAVAKYATDIE